uniref:Uncharacterized protein n=1 Tax=Opuntia streptacantha TaxID=393608 RepID=A0A7C8ZKY6_OPUST
MLLSSSSSFRPARSSSIILSWTFISASCAGQCGIIASSSSLPSSDSRFELLSGGLNIITTRSSDPGTDSETETFACVSSLRALILPPPFPITLPIFLDGHSIR